jgi:hypothetical protein
MSMPAADRGARVGGRTRPVGGRIEALISLIAALFEGLNVGISLGEAALRGFLIPTGNCLPVLVLFIEEVAWIVDDDEFAVVPMREEGRDVLNAGLFVAFPFITPASLAVLLLAILSWLDQKQARSSSVEKACLLQVNHHLLPLSSVSTLTC